MANPNPSPATRFGAGSENDTQRHIHQTRKNAATASALRARMLEAVGATIEARERMWPGEDPVKKAEENAEFFAKSKIPQLLKDTEELAKPAATIDIGNRKPDEAASDLELAQAVAAALLGSDLQAADLAGLNIIEGEAEDVSDT